MLNNRSASSCRILVVEDNALFRELIRSFLQDSGYRLLFAEDVIQATGIAIRERPDVILLDIQLPGGDGFTVMTRLKSNTHTQHIPIVVITALDETSAVAARATDFGAAASLFKPITRTELVETIERVLQASGQPAGG
jgi:CheY-like chemotaxis protein